MFTAFAVLFVHVTFAVVSHINVNSTEPTSEVIFEILYAYPSSGTGNVLAVKLLMLELSKHRDDGPGIKISFYFSYLLY